MKLNLDELLDEKGVSFHEEGNKIIEINFLKKKKWGRREWGRITIYKYKNR